MNRFLRSFTIAALAGGMALTGCNKDGAPAGDKAGAPASAGAAAAAKTDAPAKEMTADAAIMAVMAGAAKGDPTAIWNFLPASYQKDVNDMVHDFGAKVDAELWDKGFAVLGKAIGVFKNKKDFILKSPMFAQAMQNPMLPPGAIDKNWDAVVGMLDTVANSELSKAANLKTLDVGAFAAGTGKKVMGQGLALAKAMGQDPTAVLSAFKAELVKTEGDKATVKLSAPGGGEGKEEQFVKVDGKWIPADMQASWSREMGQAKAQMAAIPGEMAQAKQMAMPMLGMVEGTLDKLAGAADQAAFDGVLMGAMAAMGGGAPGGMEKPEAAQKADDAPGGDDGDDGDEAAQPE
ncbi:MAG: hypothetical protein KC549_15425 [Myxococcales bacterium]|nr:hypothetical protein [Myxococcales bacterium]MCB9549212.1 hypothetical protein [Myxococcales bacterium]